MTEEEANLARDKFGNNLVPIWCGGECQEEFRHPPPKDGIRNTIPLQAEPQLS